jgi:glutamate formiminotransferase
MRVLTIPNWSFGRNRDLLNRFRDEVEKRDVVVHYLQSDVDHNRTVSAFSGDSEAVFSTLHRLCELAFDCIDLNHHVGVHPRIGALDVCPFLALPEIPSRLPVLPLAPGEAAEGLESAPPAIPVADSQQLIADVETFSAMIAARFELPVFLYEKSERGRHEADLPSLRKGGFGGLLARELNPDFGPSKVHPTLGVTVIGVRDPLIAVNVNLAAPDPTVAAAVSREIRSLRASGDHRFLGVRALGFPLSSVNQSQVSLNLTLPDITAVDPVVEWVMGEAVSRGTKFASTELVGVIRRRDLPNASRLSVKDVQVVDL